MSLSKYSRTILELLEAGLQILYFLLKFKLCLSSAYTKCGTTVEESCVSGVESVFQEFGDYYQTGLTTLTTK